MATDGPTFNTFNCLVEDGIRWRMHISFVPNLPTRQDCERPLSTTIKSEKVTWVEHVEVDGCAHLQTVRELRRKLNLLSRAGAHLRCTLCVDGLLKNSGRAHLHRGRHPVLCPAEDDACTVTVAATASRILACRPAPAPPTIRGAQLTTPDRLWPHPTPPPRPPRPPTDAADARRSGLPRRQAHSPPPPRVFVSPFARSSTSNQQWIHVLGQHAGKRVFLPRITLCPSDDEMFPFHFKRKQFHIRLSFAMTVNKAQGQTIPNVGVYLPEPVFSHGQLYVALSRAMARSNIRVLAVPATEKDMNKEKEKEKGKRKPTKDIFTKNNVYKEVLTS